jgi:hypothetical protein
VIEYAEKWTVMWFFWKVIDKEKIYIVMNSKRIERKWIFENENNEIMKKR